MRLPTWISILVWVAVFCFTRVFGTSELTNKLNMLVRHRGWRDDMDKVRIFLNNSKNILEPMSVILEAISSNRDPIDESNVMERYKEIWTMLMCKYAEIIYKFKIFIQHFIRVCRNIKYKCDSSFQGYYDCFNLLLIKLYSSSARFQCMQDALEYLYTLGKQSNPKENMMIATEKLTKYTLTIGPETSAKLSTNGTNVDVVDREIKTISQYILELYAKNVYLYTRKHCIIPKDTELTSRKFHQDFNDKKRTQQIPEEATMMDYVVNELDCYVSEISDRGFYNLGFAYGVQGIVTIRNI